MVTVLGTGCSLSKVICMLHIKVGTTKSKHRVNHYIYNLLKLVMFFSNLYMIKACKFKILIGRG